MTDNELTAIEAQAYTCTELDLVAAVRQLRADVLYIGRELKTQQDANEDLQAQLVTLQHAAADSLDAMREYASEHIEEYRYRYAGYSRHDATIARMDADMTKARKLLETLPARCEAGK
jgi:uncharacterized protein (DUF849 family)